jgi:hypothetical protein
VVFWAALFGANITPLREETIAQACINHREDRRNSCACRIQPRRSRTSRRDFVQPPDSPTISRLRQMAYCFTLIEMIGEPDTDYGFDPY